MLSVLVTAIGMQLGTAQPPALEITNVRVTYGSHGAVRPKDAGVLPGDIVYFTFDIKNLKLDERGQASYSVGLEIRDDKGALFYEQKPYNAVAQNLFGGTSLPCSGHVHVPLDTPPGKLHWKVTIADRLANQSVTVEGRGKVLPAGFGIVRVGTFADAEGKVPVPPVGVDGSLLYVNFAVVGFGRDAKTKKPDVWVQMRVLDESGKPTFAKPIEGHVKENIAENARLVPLQFGLTMNRVGRYTIELTARCQHCNASSTVRLPVRILPIE